MNPHISKENLEDEKSEMFREMFVAGFTQRVEFTVSEKPRKTFLGSTDRKGYTIEVSCIYMSEHYAEVTEIQPWQQHAEYIVQEFIEVAKKKIANRAYEKIGKEICGALIDKK